MTDLLLDPVRWDFGQFDDPTAKLLRATVDWFEKRGKATLTSDYHRKVYYHDFLDFAAREKLFATLLTPAAHAGGNPDKRWDTARVATLSEILGFYGLNYWYPWQVTVLGLGPVWQSDNESAKADVAAALEAGAVAAFGLSEKEHGADIYSTDMVLRPDGNGGYLATGSKYYIGNGNCAEIVSVFGRIEGVDGADGYVFFRADANHPNYRVVKNIVPSQMYVAEFALEDYPVGDEEILHRGAAAFSAALNTVNIGKFNLCFGGVGLATHALYESITHTHRRILFGRPVTDFPHIRSGFVEAYTRLIAMRLFSSRAIDYFRSATPDDRRYLLFNPVTKMKVTTEAQRVVTVLADIVAAKGFEADTFVPIAKVDVDGLPKLEGTVAVNLALILKFMPNYLLAPTEVPAIGTREDAADDEFLFRQGEARGLSKVRFGQWRDAYRQRADLPNVALFTSLAESFAGLAESGDATGADMDVQLTIGELFTLIVYGGLILEQADIVGLDDDLVDGIFETLIRDFNAEAVTLLGKAGASEAQARWADEVVARPVIDAARTGRVWQAVAELCGRYEMAD